MTAAGDKYVIWMNHPSEYQSAFFSALRRAGVDICVCYYERMPEDRVKLGWKSGEKLQPGEQFVPSSLKAIEQIPDCDTRIHVHVGYGKKFLRDLVQHFCREGYRWVHWSERAHRGLRWWGSLIRKRWYANLVNQHALGSFGQGVLALQDFAKWGIRPEKMALLPYSVNACDESAAPDQVCEEYCGGRKAYLYLGALDHRKGIDILLRAYQKVCRVNEEWVLLLVGNDRSGGAYQKLAQKLGISERVLFHGCMPANEISRALKCAKVLVLPSRFDGWGVVLNEAASLGMALVATDQVGAAYHLIDPGENGFRVRAGHVDSLARALISYVRHPELADSHGEHSRHLFEAYSPERNVSRFLNAIQAWEAMR